GRRLLVAVARRRREPCAAVGRSPSPGRLPYFSQRCRQACAAVGRSSSLSHLLYLSQRRGDAERVRGGGSQFIAWAASVLLVARTATQMRCRPRNERIGPLVISIRTASDPPTAL